MRSIPLTRDEFREWLTRAKITRPINKVIYHHSWVPKAKDWNGLATLRGIRDYHIKTFDTYDIGYHFIVGPDGSIWIGRDINRIGAHAKPWNTGSIGILHLGDYDTEDPAANGYDTVVFVGAEIAKKCSVVLPNHIGHRDVPGVTKTCPGKRYDMVKLRADIQTYFTKDDHAPLYIDDYEVIGANAHIEDGKLVANSRALDRHFGWRTDWSDRFVPVRVYLEYKRVKVKTFNRVNGAILVDTDHDEKGP